MNIQADGLEVGWLFILDRFNKLNARYKYTGLPRPEFMLLHLIAKTPSGAVKISELAAAMEISMPAVSKLIKLMEEKRTIARVSDITDRRITYIAMTNLGRQHYNSALQDMRSIGLGVMELVGEQEFGQFSQVLRRLYDSFEAVMSEHDADDTN